MLPDREQARTLRVAAVQMESKNGSIEANLEHATGLIDHAARRGAELILLPEFMPTGYVFTKEIWDSGEQRDGPTVNWLRENSRRLSVWLGTSFLEADGEDFFNTFILAAPDGQEAGRVRKQTPAGPEAYFFKGDTGPHIIDTELGKVGVGICYENHQAFMLRLMHQQSVDLILMPHSAPTPLQNLFFRHKYIEMYHDMLRELASRYARALGAPVIIANKCGRLQTPMPRLPFWRWDSSFPGLSSIANSDGTVKAQLRDEESAIVEDVLLDPSRKIHDPPKCYGRWSWKAPRAWNMVRLIEAMGAMEYSLGRSRKKRARQISSQRNAR
jgi:N-carbamoylputrescine amidase